MTQAQTGTSMLSLPAGAFSALHRALASGRSAGEAAEVERRLGFELGGDFFRAFEEQTTMSGAEATSADEFWSSLSDFFSRNGWGRLDFEQVHPGVGALSSSRWAESEGEGSERHPSCHFTTGLLADMLGRVGGTPVAVLEVECRSRGDAGCRFLFGGQEALEGVFGQLQRGGSYRDAVESLR